MSAISEKTCPSCSENVKSEAKRCRHCGYSLHTKMSALLGAGILSMPYIFAWFTLRKGYSTKTRTITCVWLAIVGSYLLNAMHRGPEAAKTATAQVEPIKPPPTEAQKKVAIIEAKFGKQPSQSAWNGSYSEINRHLEAAANDPNSIKVEGCTAVSYDNKVGWLVGCDYRGKNKFGGLVRNFNWFVIRNQKVVKVLPSTAYKTRS